MFRRGGRDDGRSAVAGTRWTFDGTTLAEHHRGAENGNLFPTAHARFTELFALQTTAIAPRFAWVYDPFEVPAFPGAVYEESDSQGASRTVCWRLRPATEGGAVDHEYEIDRASPVPHATELRVFDALGRVRWRTAFGDFRALSPGVWRPFRIVASALLDGTETGRRIVVTTVIAKATRLTRAQAQAVPGSWPDDRLWFVWQ